MRKFFSKKKVVALLMATCFMLAGITGMLMAEETEVVYENVEEIITVTTSQKAPLTGSKKMTTQFHYWDELLLCEENKNGISGDLAVASVALAGAAYNVEDIDVCINKMGYTKVSTNNSYNIVSTYEDNDRVAYSISRKNVKYNGEEYGIYLVPIRGTHGNAEWYSNFNIGKESYHKGFYIAADEVTEELKRILGNDRFDKEHTILWTMGHSRGAAIANIIAGECGWDENYVIADNVYGYTYACPSVRKNLPNSTANIYNYNCRGDLVPTLPLEKWGFERYGQTIELDMNDYANFLKQFKRVAAREYEGVEDSDIYVDGLIKMMPTQESANDVVAKIVMDTIAGGMGGDGPGGLGNSLIKNGPQLDLNMKIDFALGILDEVNSIIEWVDSINDTYCNLIDRTQEAINVTKDYDEEEWAKWLENNKDFCEEIQVFSGLSVSQYGDLQYIVNALKQNWIEDIDILSTIKEWCDLFFDNGIMVFMGINDAHTPETYTLWINSMYYGFKGWHNNDTIKNVTIDGNKKVIGNYCFADCDVLSEVTFNKGVRKIGSYSFSDCDFLIDVTMKTGMEEIGASAFYHCDRLENVLIPNTVSWIDVNAFSYCTDLKRVTMPIDIKYYSQYTSSDNRSAFYGAKTESIIYSYGQTGVMADRQTSSSAEMYYGYTLESMSGDTLKSVTYAEGITNIGAYANHSCKVLTEVNIPESVTKIGEHAFEFCEALGIITIPDNVTEIGEATFHSCSSLKIVNLSENITEIKNTTFKYCEALTTIDLPEGITVIEEFGFYGCESLGEIVIPNSVTYLEADSFSECTALKKVTIPVDITYDAYYSSGNYYIAFNNIKAEEIVYTYGQTGIMPDRAEYSNMIQKYTLEGMSASTLKTITYRNGIKVIGVRAAVNCDALTTVSIPESVETIGAYAYYDCDALKVIKIPSKVTEVKSYTFYDCDALVTIKFPEGLTLIQNAGFYHCDSLGEIKIPDRITYIEREAFSDCKSLKKVTIPVDLKYDAYVSSGNYNKAFNNVKVEEIVYTYGQTGVMPDRAQYTNMMYTYTLEGISASTLKAIYFEEGITNIGAYAFNCCTALETVNMPESVTKIGQYAFNGCIGLKDIDVSKVKTIDQYAFYNCDGLTSVTILSHIGVMSQGVYGDCDNLVNVSIEYGITRIGNSSFYHCDNLKEIVIPDSVTYIEKNAFSDCKSLKKVTMPVDITYDAYASSGNYYIAFNNVKAEEIVYTYGQTGVMPNRTEYSNMIYKYTLEGMSASTLKSITFSEGITAIGERAAVNCDVLTTVNMPESIETIGAYAYYDCDGLESMKIPSKVTEVKSYTFYDCDGLTKVKLPEGLTRIKYEAFGYCDGISEIEIPDSVTYIESRAFTDCKALKKITMPVDITYDAYYSSGNYNKAFNNLKVEEIVYTYGQTGVMPDRAQYTNMMYNYTLEGVSASTLKSIYFEDGITNIGAYAAYNCANLQKVRIPESVTTIGANAFTGCGASLSIYGYMGSYAESFANNNKINFIKFLYPYITTDNDEVNLGAQIQFDAKVYLDMDETTTTEKWSVSGNTSEGTSINDSGLLTVATDENADTLEIVATYEDATNTETVYVTEYDIIDGLRVTDKLKIEGYQISYLSEGSRVLGSVEPEIYGNKVQKWGFIYALENAKGIDNPVTTADMYIGSENPFVAVFESTENGISSDSFGESTTATYFVQTMLFGHKNAIEFSANYKVRAYAQLEDGTYVYSDVSEYTVFDISKNLYENSMMNNVAGHDYLFDTILSVVDEAFEKIEYDVNKTLVG